VATDTAVYTIPLSMTRLKGRGQKGRQPLGEVRIKRFALWLRAGSFGVRLGVADSARAAELTEFVNAAATTAA